MNIIQHLDMSFLCDSTRFLDKIMRKAALKKAERADDNDKMGKRRAYKSLAAVATVAEVCIFIGLLLPLSVPIGFLECTCPPKDSYSLD